MSLPLSFYKATMGGFAAGAATAPSVAPAPTTFTSSVVSGFQANAKKEFSAVAFATDLAVRLASSALDAARF
jgi:solute carrier family 25 (adenine nucleotide translocator) protein 4/5/6/31|eukprot:6945-Pelagococcus_subviridis.AAC.4